MTTSTAAKTAKKRGGYNFSAASSPANSNAAKRSTKSKARKSPASKSKARTVNPARTATRNLDLGIASISRQTANASRQTADTVRESVDRGSKVLRGAFASAASNAKQMQEKVSSISREVSQNLAQSANKAARNANRSLEIQRENAEAAAQSYTTASKAAKKTSQQVFTYVNDLFAQNVEAARAALECRNVAELFELQSEIARQNIEGAFEQALRISELAIQSAAQALEPINESVARSSKKFAEFSN